MRTFTLENCGDELVSLSPELEERLTEALATEDDNDGILKKVLEALPEVETAEVSHEAGTAVVTLSAEVSDDVLRKAVEDQDYKVLEIQ